MTETALQEQSKQKGQCLYIVFEPSTKEWKRYLVDVAKGNL
jgi:hypothetical protein